MKTKEVKYFGEVVKVGNYIRYLATDSNGEVYGFTHKPEICGYAWALPYGTPLETGGYVYLNDNGPLFGWKTSLVEVV